MALGQGADGGTGPRPSIDRRPLAADASSTPWCPAAGIGRHLPAVWCTSGPCAMPGAGRWRKNSAGCGPAADQLATSSMHVGPIGLVFQQWILVASSWADPERSLFKAAQIVTTYAAELVSILALGDRFEYVLTALTRAIHRWHGRKNAITPRPPPNNSSPWSRSHNTLDAHGESCFRLDLGFQYCLTG